MSGSARPSQRVSGRALRALASLVRTPPGALTTRAMLRRELGIEQLARLPASYRGAVPLDSAPVAGRPPRVLHDAELGPPVRSASALDGAALVEAYRSGQATPVAVARRALAHARVLAAQLPPLGPLMSYDDAGVERDAAASAERHARGTPLGPLDGVPVVISEQLALAGLASRLGAACLPSEPAALDATVVARLRAQGALVLGHGVMTELGVSLLGVNPHRRMPRNPHDPRYAAGGASTGAAVAVALGLTPLAVGGDTNGSLRVPAALCGVFALKPTWGRVSRSGDGIGGSFEQVGVIGAGAAELASFLDAASQPDDADPTTLSALPVSLGAMRAALGRGVRGVRVGVLEGSWELASPPIARAGREALSALEREGASLVPLRFDFARYAGAIGHLLLGMEALAQLGPIAEEYGDEIGPELSILLASLASLQSHDFADAWRLRSGLRAATAALLRDVDVLAMPTTLCTAPAVSDEEARTGVLDLATGYALDRYCFLANLTGLPAATCPVGEDEKGLPVGLQILGDAFDEPTVLSVVAHLERIGAARAKRPRVRVDLLEP